MRVRRCFEYLLSRSSPWLALPTLLVGLVSLPLVAQSQQQEPVPGKASDEIEEIVVQGQAVSGIAADAPVSVTQFGAQELEALGIESVEDVAKFTPNLEIRSASATTPTFFIRGVGLNDFTANAEGAVAIFQDGVPFSLPAIQALQIYDVETLEVLRGPQGTGPYRNASAGAINVITNKPSGDFAAEIRASYGRFNYKSVEGALELPVLGDIFSTRLAFTLRQRDPFVENRCAGAPPKGIDRVTNFGGPGGRPVRIQPSYCGESKDSNYTSFPNPFDPPLDRPRVILISDIDEGLPEKLNDVDQWAARGQFRFVPEDFDMDWLLDVHGAKVDQDFPVGQVLGTRGIAVPTQADYVLGGTLPTGYRQPEIATFPFGEPPGGEYGAIYSALNGPYPIPCDPSSPFCSGSTPEEFSNYTAVRRETIGTLAENLARRLDTEPYAGDYNRDPLEKLETVGASLHGEVEFDRASLTSISAFNHYERSQEIDADYSPDVLFEFVTEEKAWQFSQQFEAQGELDTLPLRWDAGVLYVMNELDWDGYTDTRSPYFKRYQSYIQKMWSVGVFAGFEWEFLDDFSLEGGVRYNWERKDFDVSEKLDSLEAPDRCDSTTPPVICSVSTISRAPTGSLSLRYHFRDDISAYAKYSRGFKSAQLSVGGEAYEVFTLATPETLDSFEVGLNGAWFDGRLEIQAALFHYTYDNYQFFTTSKHAGVPPTRIVVNANDAVLYGAELEIEAEPLDGLRLTSRFGWLEGEFVDYTERIFYDPGMGSSVPIPIPRDVVYTGNRLPNTPQFTWSGSVAYAFEFGRYGSLTPRWDGIWTDDVYFDATDSRGIPNINGINDLPKNSIGQPAYWLHNLRLSWRSADEKIEVSGWVRNLTDEVYKSYAFDASAGFGVVGNLVGDPRTYGATVGFTW